MKYFTPFYQTLNDATSCCCRELLLLSMTVSMGMLIFAGLAYALEKDEPGTMFYTLPQVRHVLSRVTCHVSIVTRVTCDARRCTGRSSR